jgi:hypothetical protein
MDRSVSPLGGAAVIVAATPADKALIRPRHQRDMESAVNHRSGEMVPKSLRPIYEQIVGMTDAFCRQHLDSDYAALCIKMAAALARKRPSPLTRSHTRSWAGAILYVLGRLNFLFDPSQHPHMKGAELCSLLGLSLQTVSSKARLIERMLGVELLDPRWCVPSILEHNPLVWMIVVDGFLIDARNAPREMQEAAYRKGLIPFIPERSGE